MTRVTSIGPITRVEFAPAPRIYHRGAGALFGLMAGKEFAMGDIIAQEIVISEDIAAGEIVEGELKCEGKRTGVFITARVVVNNDEMVQLSLSDLPQRSGRRTGRQCRSLWPC